MHRAWWLYGWSKYISQSHIGHIKIKCLMMSVLFYVCCVLPTAAVRMLPKSQSARDRRRSIDLVRFGLWHLLIYMLISCGVYNAFTECFSHGFINNVCAFIFHIVFFSVHHNCAVLVCCCVICVIDPSWLYLLIPPARFELDVGKSSADGGEICSPNEADARWHYVMWWWRRLVGKVNGIVWAEQNEFHWELAPKVR